MNRFFLTMVIVLTVILFASGQSVACTSWPEAEISCPDPCVSVGETVYLNDGGSYDPDNDPCSGTGIVAYEWIFPDEAYYICGRYNKNAKCKFYPAGTYEVKLKVTDDEGWSSQTTVEITVEAASNTQWYVKADGNDDSDGHDWDHAFRSIDVGIGSADDEDTVTAEEGIYNESISFRGRDITVTSTNPDDPAVVANTVIDSVGLASVVTFEGTETSDCKLTGFTIRDGGLQDDVDTSNPVAHWKLDETSGDALDSSGNDHHGTLSGAPTWVPSGGKINGALSFDGDNDYVEMSQDNYKGITGTNPRTCAAWIKKDSTAWGDIISWGDNVDGERWHLWVDGDGHLRLAVKGGYVVALYTNLNDGNWHHVAATFEIGADGNPNEANVTDVKLYVDGKEDTYTTSTQGINTGNDQNVKIGLLTTSNAKYFDGIIDDVRIYNKALSAKEVSELADIREPVGHWKLDESASSPDPCEAVDSSDNGNTGYLQNMEDTDWTAGKFGNALEFDGTDEYVTITGYKGITGKNARTCAAWIRINLGSSDSDYATIVSWGNNNSSGERWQFMLRDHDTDSEYQLRVSVKSGAKYGSTDLNENDNQWHHVAVTWEDDGTPDVEDVKLYVDGVEETDCTTDSQTINTDGNKDVRIGDYNSTNNYFKGNIDDVRIYDRALTEGEIGQLYRGGGGIYGNDTTGATIDKCVITENSALEGGAVNYAGTIKGCTISGNSSPYNGGGFSNCSGTVRSCIVSSNTAQDYGGGFYNCDGATIENCTIVDNSSVVAGGGLKDCDGTTTITNCIIWGNDPCQLVDSSTPTYSCIEDWSGGGTGNINSDPCFVDSANDDYHIQPISPCIDEGDPCGTYSGQTDIDGDDRVIDIGGEGNGNVDVDMGADEFLPVPLQANSPLPGDSTTGVNIDAVLSWTAGLYAELHDVYLGQSYNAVLNATKVSAEYKGTQSSTIYDHPVSFDYATYYWRIDEVNSTGTTTGNVWSFTTCYDHCFVDNSGSPSWPNVFTDIHFALNAVCESGVIWVADGTYTITNAIYIGQSKEDVCIYGGFAGDENPDTFDLDDRNFTTNETIIDGDNAENFICVWIHYDCTIDGFTIKNAGSSTKYGIGISCYDISSACTIANCNITNNGKGMDIISSTSPMITNCTFSGNGYYTGYSYAGSGMSISSSSPTVSNCEFSDNISTGLGIGGSIEDTSPTISNCVFNENGNADSDGGGIDIFIPTDYSYITIENCIFTNNTAEKGGGIYAYLHNTHSDLEISNCVFYQNNATYTGAAGGGLHAADGSSTEELELFNCLFISNGNSSSKGGAIACKNNYSLEAVNCTFYGNIASQGGAVYSTKSSGKTTNCDTDLINCILWGNTATSGHEVYCDNSGIFSNTITLEYCDIENTTGWMREDTGNKAYVDWENNENIYGNPLFDDTSDPDGTDNTFRTSDDGFALTLSSGCRNTGDNVTGYPYYLSEDITNGGRKVGTAVDRGAYEYGN